MIVQAPSFIDSKYLIIDERGWRLKAGAPDELIKEFKEFMKLINLNEKPVG